MGSQEVPPVYVCLCNGVSDRKVRKAIARGATTVDELARTCGAGSGCGGCRPELEQLLRGCTGACAVPEAGRLAASAHQ